MTKYLNKLQEVSMARNSSKTAAKVRPVRWTKKQMIAIRTFAIQEICPTIDDLRKKYWKLGDHKLECMFKLIKNKRREFSELTGINDIDGIRNAGGKGYVYLLENELYPGWIKCGMTVNLEKRLQTYNTNDPLKRYKFVSSMTVNDRRKIEKMIMEALLGKSSLNNGEWFRIEKNIAINIFSQFK
jgi:hypothetical protein